MIISMSNASTAPIPSYVTLPDLPEPYPSILDFLDQRFPKVGRDVWQSRLASGKVIDDAGCCVRAETPYQPHLRLQYFREVPAEPEIPFKAEILFENDHLLAACKPHFLPVTPAGPYVNQCLLYRLQNATGIRDVVPIHRIDRETAGIVLFSKQKATRGVYHDLFQSNQVRKVYEAVTTLPENTEQDEWLLRTRIVPGEPWFRVQHADGPPNAVTRIVLLDRNEQAAYLRLEPQTGKQHQLRLHVTCIGAHILYDRYYPVLTPKRPDDFARPLQLLARSVAFVDPMTQQPVEFRSMRHLAWDFRGRHPVENENANELFASPEEETSVS